MMNDYGNLDHNSSPVIKILYPPNGNMRESNFVVPYPPSQLAREFSQNSLQQHSTRKQLDSGYEEQEEDYLVANKSSLSERQKENQLAVDNLGSTRRASSVSNSKLFYKNEGWRVKDGG